MDHQLPISIDFSVILFCFQLLLTAMELTLMYLCSSALRDTQQLGAYTVILDHVEEKLCQGEAGM